jgi:hypothetical protein
MILLRDKTSYFPPHSLMDVNAARTGCFPPHSSMDGNAGKNLLFPATFLKGWKRGKNRLFPAAFSQRMETRQEPVICRQILDRSHLCAVCMLIA